MVRRQRYNIYRQANIKNWGAGCAYVVLPQTANKYSLSVNYFQGAYDYILRYDINRVLLQTGDYKWFPVEVYWLEDEMIIGLEHSYYLSTNTHAADGQHIEVETNDLSTHRRYLLVPLKTETEKHIDTMQRKILDNENFNLISLGVPDDLLRDFIQLTNPAQLWRHDEVRYVQMNNCGYYNVFGEEFLPTLAFEKELDEGGDYVWYIKSRSSFSPSNKFSKYKISEPVIESVDKGVVVRYQTLERSVRETVSFELLIDNKTNLVSLTPYRSNSSNNYPNIDYYIFSEHAEHYPSEECKENINTGVSFDNAKPYTAQYYNRNPFKDLLIGEHVQNFGTLGESGEAFTVSINKLNYENIAKNRLINKDRYYKYADLNTYYLDMPNSSLRLIVHEALLYEDIPQFDNRAAGNLIRAIELIDAHTNQRIGDMTEEVSILDWEKFSTRFSYDGKYFAIGIHNNWYPEGPVPSEIDYRIYQMIDDLQSYSLFFEGDGEQAAEHMSYLSSEYVKSLGDEKWLFP